MIQFKQNGGKRKNVMAFRIAKLEDTTAICELFCRTIVKWQRLDANGIAQDVPYQALTIYERWLHGGAWTSLETGVLWLSHLLRGAGVPIVLFDATGLLVGYAELFPSEEPAPFGKHSAIGMFLVHPEAPPHTQSELLNALVHHADSPLSVSLSAYDEDSIAFYRLHGFYENQSIKRYTISTQSGQGFYKTTDHPLADFQQIKGWGMPIGRTSSARYHWEAEWAGVWSAIPELAQQRTNRLKISVSTQEAFLYIKAHLYEPRTADVLCWSNKAFSASLLVALRDWASRSGYRHLTVWATETVAKLFDNSAEASLQQQVTLIRSGA